MYNNSKQSSTDKTSFKLCLYFNSVIHMQFKDKIIKTNKVPSAKKIISNTNNKIYQKVDL